ncbi:MAG TPA: acyl-CoA dehydrogenase family protein, partial [Thermoanaerobaculia bacterium]
QHPLAEASVRLEAVRLMAWRAAVAFDGGAPPKEVSLHGNAAKLLAAELAAKALDAAFKTLGGKGFDERCGVVHLLEFVALLQVAPISEALILNQVAESALGLPRSY